MAAPIGCSHLTSLIDQHPCSWRTTFMFSPLIRNLMLLLRRCQMLMDSIQRRKLILMSLLRRRAHLLIQPKEIGLSLNSHMALEAPSLLLLLMPHLLLLGQVIPFRFALSSLQRPKQTKESLNHRLCIRSTLTTSIGLRRLCSLVILRKLTWLSNSASSTISSWKRTITILSRIGSHLLLGSP